MKHSIKAIFKNLNTYLFFVLFIAFMAMVLTFEQRLSFEKVNNLNEQKEIITKLTTLQRDDVELALIQFNGKSTYLLNEIDKLRNLYKYNFSDRFLFGNSQEYLGDLGTLTSLTKAFNNAAHEYYVETETKDPKIEKETKANLDSTFVQLITHINSMLFKNTGYDQTKFYIAEIAMAVYFLIAFFGTLLYRNRLNKIFKDIEYLYQMEKSKSSYDIFSLEADAISLRMNRKAVNSDNPAMLDPVTGINNHKGMINAYSQKKGLKNSNFTSVTVLEIDNFSKSKRTFSQETTQAILKKVAYTISLHEQPVDVIARTDYNQFTLILSRPSKEQSFKDVDLIRQSISELRFNVPDQGTANITVSGGFIIKPNNTNLEEATKQAKEVLLYAKNTGTNKILQMRDMAEKEM
ncbi:MAG: diguanylate cyclase [Campylobacterales bacterium]|nr:diguanylate cyclase [Campylobacterales bacterium]